MAKYSFSYYCDQGIRENNQDACFISENKSGQVFAIVCDGVGSEKHSEVASQIAISMAATEFINTQNIEFKSFFYNFAEDAQKKIIKTMKEEYPGKPSSTTVACCLLDNNKAHVAWIGDSRIYHYSNATKEWKQISVDQNLLTFINRKWNRILETVKKSPNHTEEDIQMTNESFERDLERHKSNLLAITGVLENTTNSYKSVEMEEFEVAKDDLIWISSDGVYNWIHPEDIGFLLKSGTSIENLAHAVVKLALANGSNDNSTSIIIKVE